jgi:subtilisin-like proprotein convertase family protein
VAALSGLVSKVTVTVTNLSHTWPADISILLVGPGGQTTMLMSDAGGNNGVTPISNVTLTFDDAAASLLPETTLITSGTYQPTSYDSDEVLDAPAPAGPYATALSAFNGVNPNGTWSLYVDDDYPAADGGSIANGWKITIVTTTNNCCGSGANPNNPASVLRISGIKVTGNDVSLTWSTAGGSTNVVQAAPDLGSSYSNISPNIFILGSGDTSTNYLDTGGATNRPTRFYRIKLVP